MTNRPSGASSVNRSSTRAHWSTVMVIRQFLGDACPIRVAAVVNDLSGHHVIDLNQSAIGAAHQAQRIGRLGLCKLFARQQAVAERLVTKIDHKLQIVRTAYLTTRQRARFEVVLRSNEGH